MMVEVCLGLGSNVEPKQNIRSALNALAQHFDALEISRVFQSEAIGFDGRDFHNLVVVVKTDLSPAPLVEILRGIENENGRDRSQPRFSPRTLDIDVLTFGTLVGDYGGIQLPRNEILKNAFVLWPLAELRPNAKHPVTLQTYAELWNAFDKNSQKLKPVDFFWRGEFISRA